MRAMRLWAAALLSAPLGLLPTVGRAQERGPEPSAAEIRALRSRMATLADSMRGYELSESFAEWFPREGTWVWRQTLHGAPEGGDRVVAWRFPAAQTVQALSSTGPLCPSFFRGGGEVGTFPTTIAGRLSDDSVRWRQVGLRFVPRGASASSPAFVEWRREGGRWVISEFGDEHEYVTPRPRAPRTIVRRSREPGPLLALPLPEDARYAASAGWFLRSVPLWLGGLPRVKYGLPIHLGSGDVTRIGWVEGVAVYAEPSAVATPEVIYVAVDHEGAFQPYQPAGNYYCH
jgi:hypothetical protein